MNPVLLVIYHLLKYVVKAALWIYYSKITVTGRPRSRFGAPCILVSNHPSTLLDPLNAVVEVKSEVFFLANAGLFRNPVAAWLLRKLYCIPIERVQDTGGKPLDNAASFEQSSLHLAAGGCLYVAPEGSSFVERQLRKIKTGTARIALDAESRHHFRLGLTILPVGLNYSDPTQFRSELLKVYGEPIRVADFQKDWEGDEIEAVRTLTNHVEEQLSALIIDTEDDAEDEVLRCLEVIFQNENPLPPYPGLQRSQEVLGCLRQWKTDAPAAFEEFSVRVFSYFETIKSLEISDLAVKNAGQPDGGLLEMLVAFPIFLLGYATHFLPTFAAKKITDRLNGDFHWVPTYKFTAGVITYPLFLGLQIWGVSELVGDNGWLTWAYVLSIVPTGLVAEWWLKKWQRWREDRWAAFLAKNKKATWDELTDLRHEILLIVTDCNDVRSVGTKSL